MRANSISRFNFRIFFFSLSCNHAIRSFSCHLTVGRRIFRRRCTQKAPRPRLAICHFGHCFRHLHCSCGVRWPRPFQCCRDVFSTAPEDYCNSGRGECCGDSARLCSGFEKGRQVFKRRKPSARNEFRRCHEAAVGAARSNACCVIMREGKKRNQGM